MTAGSSETRSAPHITGKTDVFAFIAFSLRRAWQGFWRNGLMSLAAMATMVLMLVLLSGLIMMLAGLDATINYVGQKVQVVAYMKDSAPKTDVDRIQLVLDRKSTRLNSSHANIS